MSPADDWMLGQDTVDFREEERRHRNRTDAITDRDTGDENDACTCPECGENMRAQIRRKYNTAPGHHARHIIGQCSSGHSASYYVGPNHDECICRKYAGHNPECPKHGKPGQLTLDDPRANPHFYDPEEADIPY